MQNIKNEFCDVCNENKGMWEVEGKGILCDDCFREKGGHGVEIVKMEALGENDVRGLMAKGII